ncbi:hypothetical protein FIBSPDRAFT_735854 [Athelia psychrophila]|uniref:Uncharacterized protein n=1 Tax=Athelia psychrophila TaxID=1759441 RepID=A0A166MYT4_9AGAM|nr:hypothetical protein FIBSPDRAFT_735854 [Fibularhizoctonia sp. CBS 109695]
MQTSQVTIGISDEDEDKDEEPSVSKGKKLKSPDKEPPKKRLKVDSTTQKPSSSKSARSRGNVQAEAGPSTPKTKNKPASEASEVEHGGGEKSDSDMSVLIDATPVKRKAKGDKKPKKASEPTKGKKPAKAGKSTLSKDEEAVKRLKSYVNACGVRKVWSKEFQDLDQPSQQIKHLKELLDELGMEGRPTLEKAKAIKEQREIAQELKDVQSFEQSISRQSGRTRSKADNASGNGSEAESSDRAAPTKKRNTARQSIMAFLGDESESE